jgi:hypothetical protein
VIERIEGDDRIERLSLQLERREVRLDEFGFWYRESGAAHLLGGNVDAGDPKARGETPCVGHTGSAAEFEHPRSVLQPRHELFLPLATWIAHDPITPLCEAVADRVVPTADKFSAWICWSTASI